MYVIIRYIFVPEASGLHTYEHYFMFLAKAISLSSVKITFDPFFFFSDLSYFVKREKKNLTEVTGPKLSSYKND